MIYNLPASTQWWNGGLPTQPAEGTSFWSHSTGSLMHWYAPLIQCYKKFYVESVWSSPSIGSLMYWYPTVIQFLKANVPCLISKGLQRPELLLCKLECQLPPGILHQLCRWGQSWSRSTLTWGPTYSKFYVALRNCSWKSVQNMAFLPKWGAGASQVK